MVVLRVLQTGCECVCVCVCVCARSVVYRVYAPGDYHQTVKSRYLYTDILSLTVRTPAILDKISVIMDPYRSPNRKPLGVGG